jgi:hypothetical protein
VNPEILVFAGRIQRTIFSMGETEREREREKAKEREGERERETETACVLSEFVYSSHSMTQFPPVIINTKMLTPF